MGAPFGNQNRAKDRPVTEAMRKMMIQNPERIYHIIEAQAKKAQEGDLNAARFIAEYAEGKPHQTAELELSGNLSQALAAVSKE